MRGLVATLALIVSIGGLLVVIAYAASDAYLNYGDDTTDLDNTLLLGTIAPAGWEASSLVGVAFSEQFIAPCLQTPLLEGASITGRGAHAYAPAGSGTSGAQLLLIQTSATDARGIMDDVARDTEDNCRRGLSAGTVDRAEVEPGGVEGTGGSVLVTYERQAGDATATQLALIVQQETYVALFSYDLTDAPTLVPGDLLDLGNALAARIDNPPTAAQLAAAGALDEPSTMEERAQRVHDETSRILTAEGRYPELVGVAGLSLVVLILYITGARLSRQPGPLPEAAPALSTSGAFAPSTPQTIDDYGVPERRWIRTSERGRSKDVAEPAGFALELLEPPAPEELDLEEAEPEPSGPPPVLDFPQKSIEEKLKILKDARLKEPRREHRAVREVTPNVDWTEEISKPSRDERQDRDEPPTGQISRKALLRKLHSNPPDSE